MRTMGKTMHGVSSTASARELFWQRVDACSHEATENYGVHVSCSHEELGCAGGFEWHCKHCGVYITDDPCGAVAGMSGWPHARWKKNGLRCWSSWVRWGAEAVEETP